ncbi:MAG: acyltransferase [Spirochaetales bacterium]|nr:acyltransferase [Spirochaetales bacterium]
MSLNNLQKIFISPVNVSKDNAFNFLRLVCCLIVIYEHCVVLSGADFPCYDLRGIAVNVFFILSGFWVTQSFLKSGSIKNYTIKRCKKILPQYWLVVLICAICLSAFSALPLREYFCNGSFYKYLAANIFTLNFIQPNLPGVFEGLALNGSVNGSLWTIKIEIGFYILLPFIVFAVKKLREKFNGGGYECIVLAALYLLSVLYEVFMPFVTEKTSLPSSLNNQFPAFISYFVSGIAFAFYGERLFPKLKIAFLPCLAILVLLNVFKIPFASALLVPVCLAVCVMFLGLNLKIFADIGRKTDYSYSLYLVHYPLAMCFVSLGLFEKIPGFAIFCVLGTSFLCAYLLEIFQQKIFGTRRNAEAVK